MQADRPRDGHAQFVDVAALVLAQSRGRRFLDQLLVATLDRAVALAQGHDVALRVTQQLDLDVPRVFDIAFQVHRTVAEGGRRLAGGSGEGLGKITRRCHAAHAASATARRRLDHQRKANALAVGDQLAHVARGIGRLECPGHDRDAGRLGARPRRQFVAELSECGGRRTDECDTGRGAGLRERRLLRQESVSRMQCLGARRAGGGDDGVEVEVALTGRGATDGHCPVGGADMRRIDVGRRVDGYRFDPQFTTRADDAERDLAAIGNQQRPERPAGLAVFAQRHRGYSGMLPCLRGRFDCRLPSSMVSAAMTRGLVSAGMITSST